MKTILDDLAELLVNDSAFVAAMQALNLGSTGNAALPQVITGNRPFASLGQDRYPCWVMEEGDEQAAPISEGGDADGLVIGSSQQSFRAEIYLALVWHQQTPDTAAAQRGQLLQPLVSLLLRNQLDDTINAWVSSLAQDGQALHPTHVARFTLTATHTLSP